MGRAGLLILAAALAIRVAVVLLTPNYVLVHDAIDYDNHAWSIASGHGFALSYGRETAFRPPAYPYFLAGVYLVFGRSLEAGRIANAFVGTGIVWMIGVLALQLWGRRVALVAMALGAIYVPLILVGQSVMSEPLFVLCMLGSLAAVLRRWALVAGVLMGLAILGRANALILLLPLAWAVWRYGSWRSVAVLLAAAALTVLPWTVRNAVELHHFVPVSTQFGSALAGTYNSDAMNDRENPASWRSLKRVSDYQDIFSRVRTTNEAVLEKELRSASLDFIKEHPAYVLTVGYWTTRRMLDLASLDWSIHTASTISVGRFWGVVGVICFWVFALLAVAGAFTARAREAPLWFWSVPLLMYLGVVFLVVETPRYRSAIDPFVVLLAALALTIAVRDRRANSGAPASERVPGGDPVGAGGAAAGG
jgi:4-amino-4-deoxy-L-arabinose transferase-like glycosyltransferase